MTTRTFGDLTFWHSLAPIRIGGGWDPGWRVSDGAFAENIGRADTYWGEVLQRAKQAYGDPNMRFDTDDTSQDRYLTFGDGTRVPADGSLAYHDAATKTTYLQNTDGSVTPLSATGKPGDPLVPVGLRRGADGQLAPIDASGHQVSPLLALPTPAPNGYHDDGGVLTPKNAAGDYYTLGPDGHRRFFDAGGNPIDEDRFTKDGASPPPSPGGGPGSSTDEQQTGHAAAAVKKLQDELRGRYGKLSQAEEQLSEAMLTAHATTAEGSRRLDAIQHDIVDAVNDPASSPDTSAGQQAYLKFLRGKVSAIQAIVDSGALVADDQSRITAALSDLYATDGGSPPTDGPPAEPPSAAPVAVAAPPPAVDDPGPTESGDAGLGPAPAMPDPTLSDVLGGPLGALGTDPTAALSSLAPGALGGLGGLGGGGLGGGDPLGLGPLSGLGGAASPLAGLASQLGDRSQPDDSKTDESGVDHHDGEAKHVDQDGKGPATDGDPSTPADARDHPGTPPADPQPAGEPGQGAPPAAPGPAPAPTSTVTLPDGSSTTATSPKLARAVTAYLAGSPVDEAYRLNGIQLPPPGTPVTDPVDPGRLSCGFLGVFGDHYVVAASAVKAIADGQVVPLSSVTSSPDFLGWIDPSTLATTPSPATVAPPVAAGAPAG